MTDKEKELRELDAEIAEMMGWTNIYWVNNELMGTPPAKSL